MPIKINGQTTGSVTLTAPATGSDVTVTIPSSSNTTVATSDTAFMLSSIISPSNRNRVINGSFDIWQRGTSFSFSGASGNYTADRWAYYTDGTGSAVTVSRQSFTAGSAPVAGYEGTYFIRVNRTGVGSGNTYSNLQQPIEDVRTFAGQTVTVSFWAKADSNRTMSVSLTQDFGTGGSSAVNTGAIGTASVTTSWQRFSYSVALPSIAGKTISATDSKLYIFLQCGNSVSTFDFWGVQVEEGSIATAFETEHIGDTLIKCQRYYELIDGGDVIGICGTSANFIFWYYYKVEKRITPIATMSITSGTTFHEHYASNRTSTSGAVNAISKNMVKCTLDGSSGLTIGRPGYYLGTVSINAEL